MSPELAQTSKPESSQNSDSSSQAPAPVAEEEKDRAQSDDAHKDQVDDPEKSTKNSSELRKTWGFRRTTIAKRDMAGETSGPADSPGAPVRRSGRQAKRTDKLEEFLVTVKRGRGATRRSAPAYLEGGDPLSETASEASLDRNMEADVLECKTPSPVMRTRGRGRGRATPKPKADITDSTSEDDSSEDEEKVMTEAQEQLEVETGAEDAGTKEVVEEVQQELPEKRDEDTKMEEDPPNTKPSRSPLKSGPKREAKLRSAACKGMDDDEDADDYSSSSSSESDSDGYDPNALYCICRQKHNKRFMICCDRCEEWFHGDCVGITEARGRLMERNSEDYVCPNCTAQKAQSPRLFTSATGAECKRSATLTALRKAEPGQGLISQTSPQTPTTAAGQLSAALPATEAPPAAEEKTGEEVGIKGRIEKATNPSGKKKIKIFQPQVMVSAEESSLPKCIGPGCERDALPDSVYCGNDCILKHAAAAMKTITTDNKETKPKDKPKPKILKKPPVITTVKNSVPERRSTRRSTESSGNAQEESPETEGREHEDEEDEEDRIAEEHPPPPAMSSWSSDHNYIAVAPEKTTAISPTVLNKACMYLKGFPHFNPRSLCDLRCRTDGMRNEFMFWPRSHQAVSF